MIVSCSTTTTSQAVVTYGADALCRSQESVPKNLSTTPGWQKKGVNITAETVRFIRLSWVVLLWLSRYFHDITETLQVADNN
jgi:hypothetical protein